ncbi:Lipase [Macleaya cordata]|uniref:Lipase n=1 Tax=Macleaya cordata TaxID=56857 RepID=A0A200PXW9_MACCD|nr:Lipase [Macleaya cordata]
MLSITSTSTIHHHIPLPSTFHSTKNHQSSSFKIRANQKVIVEPNHSQTKNRTARLAETLSNLVHLHLDTPLSNVYPHHDDHHRMNFHNQKGSNTPTKSPKENISTKWNEIHRSTDYDSLLNPLHPWLRREILKYGEFAQATYDAFDFDSFSEYCGSCRYNSRRLFDKLGLSKNGYKVSKYIYAMSHVDVPRWLERSHLVDTWSRDSNWMGYIAVSDNEESQRIGRRDIVVAWRGTVAPSEWFEDLQNKLEPIGDHGEVKVEHGFRHIYTSKSESTRYNKSSASEQVMNEVQRLVKLYREKGEQVSLTITGHSLGGALALLNAYEAAESIPDLPISVISFGAPRVGNIAFRDKLHQMGVKTLRVVVKQDLVPRMPGIMLNESLQKFEEITGNLDWVYTHVGAELKLNVRSSPYLKRGFDLLGFHSLETYLHLVDGFVSAESSFRENARRDVALVNKACGMLVDEMRIPQSWYQLEHKGLVQNSYGRWVKPSRDPEDIPSSHHVNERSSTTLPCLA